MTHASNTRTLRWILAVLAIGLGFSPEVVLCVSTGHVTVEMSGCCVSGAPSTVPARAATQVEDHGDDTCGPCVDVPLETGALGRLIAADSFDILASSAPASSVCRVATFAPSHAVHTPFLAHAHGLWNTHQLQSVRLLI